MRPVTIENPILNSPFEEPSRYFRFDDEGVTNEVLAGRRRSEFSVRVPRCRTLAYRPTSTYPGRQPRQESAWLPGGGLDYDPAPRTAPARTGAT